MSGPQRLDPNEPAPADLFDRLSPPDQVVRSLPNDRLVHRVIQLAQSGDDPERLAAYRAELEWRLRDA